MKSEALIGKRPERTNLEEDKLEEGEIIEDDDHLQKPSKMYKLNKRNLKHDEKAKDYLERTRRALLNAKDTDMPEKNSKDLKNELIMQIFKEEEDEDGDDFS